MRLRSCDSSGHSTNECSSPDAFKPLLHSPGVSWNISDFCLLFFYHPGYSGDWFFFFSANFVIFSHESFSNAFLIASWLITRGFENRWRSFMNSEAFKRCYTRWTSILLTFSYLEITVFLKPSSSKEDISILLVSIRRYLTLSDFL